VPAARSLTCDTAHNVDACPVSPIGSMPHKGRESQLPSRADYRSVSELLLPFCGIYEDGSIQNQSEPPLLLVLSIGSLKSQRLQPPSAARLFFTSPPLARTEGGCALVIAVPPIPSLRRQLLFESKTADGSKQGRTRASDDSRTEHATHGIST
jgi:hypothetical protein